jgi:hypothetical protein
VYVSMTVMMLFILLMRKELMESSIALNHYLIYLLDSTSAMASFLFCGRVVAWLWRYVGAKFGVALIKCVFIKN